MINLGEFLIYQSKIDVFFNFSSFESPESVYVKKTRFNGKKPDPLLFISNAFCFKELYLSVYRSSVLFGCQSKIFFLHWYIN